MIKTLLLGAGTNRQKRVIYAGRSDWGVLTTLDIDAGLKPSIVWDLNKTPIPAADDSFDEIHAYEVLEHVGKLGDWAFFFRQFDDFWRLLKPGGVFCATCPSLTSPWLFGDPGHTRVICQEMLTFLSRDNYEQVGKTAMTDYRKFFKGDWNLLFAQNSDGNFCFALQAVKPARS